ncbi:unnamed protein product [Effrenium voratum]|nr:unnamed protein product [Effrenium voratum]|mmetsp:Transcript_135006/g.320070  ORF Transcript_135006/g.320070 Transcript_135006/m.320070 type:complete len:175 (+) Transcript_135006:218-742(+)
MVKARPTVGFNMETVEHNHLKLKVFDFGGRSKIRRFWHHYSPDADGVIFVVDSTDGERMGEAKEELQAMMGKRELERAVVLVLANKKDWPKFPCLSHVVPMPPKQSSCNCWGVGHAEVTEVLQLRKRQVWSHCTSAPKGFGLSEAMDWLSSSLACPSNGSTSTTRKWEDLPEPA